MSAPINTPSTPMSVEDFTACKWVFAIHADSTTSVWRGGEKVLSVDFASGGHNNLAQAIGKYEARTVESKVEAERLANLFIASILGRVRSPLPPPPSSANSPPLLRRSTGRRDFSLDVQQCKQRANEINGQSLKVKASSPVSSAVPSVSVLPSSTAPSSSTTSTSSSTSPLITPRSSPVLAVRAVFESSVSSVSPITPAPAFKSIVPTLSLSFKPTPASAPAPSPAPSLSTSPSPTTSGAVGAHVPPAFDSSTSILVRAGVIRPLEPREPSSGGRKRMIKTTRTFKYQPSIPVAPALPPRPSFRIPSVSRPQRPLGGLSVAQMNRRGLLA